MSGLALVCARLGATVSGSDRSDSSYMERLRAAGLEPVVGHDAANLPDGRRGRRLDRDRRRQPGAGAGPRARGRADPPRRPAGRALRREAADRDRRHPRQDDDDRDGGLGAAGDRRRPGLLRRRRGAGPRDGGGRRQRRLGRGRVGRRRGRRERRQLPRAEARDRRRHQRRDGPPHPLGLAGRAAPGLPRVRRAGRASCCCGDAQRSTDRRRGERVGFDAGSPGPPTWRWPSPAATTAPTPAPPWPRSSWPGSTSTAAAAALADFPGVRRRLELKGPAAAPAYMTTTPTTRPRCAPRSRPCASSSPSA